MAGSGAFAVFRCAPAGAAAGRDRQAAGGLAGLVPASVLAAALTVLMAIGVGLFFTKNGGIYKPSDDVVALTMLCRRQNPARRWAICSLWKRITICIPTSICWMTWKCSTM